MVSLKLFFRILFFDYENEPRNESPKKGRAQVPTIEIKLTWKSKSGSRRSEGYSAISPESTEPEPLDLALFISRLLLPEFILPEPNRFRSEIELLLFLLALRR